MKNMKTVEISLEDFYVLIGKNADNHDPKSEMYSIFNRVWKNYIEKQNLEKGFSLGPLGSIKLLPTTLGKIKVSDLFYIGELIIFIYYLINKNKYKTVLDLGANIGVHSIIMNNLGWHVEAFEPTPKIFEDLLLNLKNNASLNVSANEKAVSDYSGTAEFVDLESNKTGNHISNKKQVISGVYSKFTVRVEDIRGLVEGIDLVKMDVEGSESDCLLALNEEHFNRMDIFCEVSSIDQANKIFTFGNSRSLNLFSQKIGWKKVNKLEEMPSHWSEGTLFITTKDSMEWL